jgi:hypothetical protein
MNAEILTTLISENKDLIKFLVVMGLALALILLADGGEFGEI